MSLNFTASYRIKKGQQGAAAQRKNPLNQLRRKTTSSPRKSSSASSTPPVSSISGGNEHDDDNDSLSLYYPSWPAASRSALPTTVLEGMKYILSHQFTALPPTLTGLGLSRDLLAEVLNYRKLFPSVVPLPHLHSVLMSPTDTEREITSLVADGTLRRVTIKTGNMTTLDGVVLTDDFLKSVASSSALDADTKDAFLSLFMDNPSLATITSDPAASNTLPKENIMALLSAGFLTINSTGASMSSEVDITTLTPTTAMTYITPLPEKDHSHISTLASLSSISSNYRNASKSSPDGHSSKSSKPNDAYIEYTITPPYLGLLTNLYSTTKSHLLDILRHCPHRQATIEFIREKWDGGVSKNKNSVRRKKEEVKYEGRTRKWREHKGVTVEWVLGGLLGSGVIEGFGKGWSKGVKLVKGN